MTNYPVPSPYPAAPEPATTRRPALRGSAALAWTKERLARGAPRLHNALAHLGLWDPIGGATLDPDDEIRVYKRRRQPAIDAAWEVTAAILSAFASETRAAGQGFAVVYVPARFEVNDRDWELTKLMFGLEEPVWDRGLVAERLRAIGSSAGFDVLDLTAALRRAERGILGGPYFVYDGHWNGTGHRVAGRAVAAYLRARGWVPACAADASIPRRN